MAFQWQIQSLPKVEPGFFSKLGYSTYENVVDLLPFIFTAGISLLIAQHKIKDGAGDNNKVLKLALEHSPVVIPTVFALSNVYGRISTIRDTRKFVGEDVNEQNALTRQQDQILAKYAFWTPASILAAKRLASSPDSLARIGYIVATYLAAAGQNSPFDLFRNGVASILDSYRIKENKEEAQNA